MVALYTWTTDDPDTARGDKSGVGGNFSIFFFTLFICSFILLGFCFEQYVIIFLGISIYLFIYLM